MQFIDNIPKKPSAELITTLSTGNASTITPAPVVYKSDNLNGDSYSESDRSIISTTIKYDADGSDSLKNNYQVLVNNGEPEKPDLLDYKMQPYLDSSVQYEHGFDDKRFNMANMNYITQFYICSLTVIGLFIFFRFIQKSK
jgi:hypothetical protein